MSNLQLVIILSICTLGVQCVIEGNQDSESIATLIKNAFEKVSSDENNDDVNSSNAKLNFQSEITRNILTMMRPVLSKIVKEIVVFIGSLIPSFFSNLYSSIVKNLPEMMNVKSITLWEASDWTDLFVKITNNSMSPMNFIKEIVQFAKKTISENSEAQNALKLFSLG